MEHCETRVSAPGAGFSLMEWLKCLRAGEGCSTEMAISVKEMGISVTETAASGTAEGSSVTAEGFAVMAEGSDFTRRVVP